MLFVSSVVGSVHTSILGVCNDARRLTPACYAVPAQLTSVPESAVLLATLGQLSVSVQQLAAGQERLAAVLGPLVREASVVRRQRLNPWRSSNRSRAEQAEFKEALIAFYSCAAAEAAGKPMVRCMVTDRVLPRPAVIASHIWKHSTLGVGLEEFGLRLADVSSARNGLLMCSKIENQFDILNVAFSYDLFVDKFRFHVLDPSLLALPVVVVDSSSKAGQDILSGYGTDWLHDIPTFQQLDGQVMRWAAPALPFRRLLAWHYALARSKWSSRLSGASSPERELPTASLRSPGWGERSPDAQWPEEAAMELYDHAASKSLRDAAEDDEQGGEGEDQP